MSIQVDPLGVLEVAPLVVNAGAGSFFSVGADLSTNAQFGELACLVVISGAFDVANFDFIVQTARAGVTDDASWTDLTSSRANFVTTTGTLRIAVVDPVLDQVRLRVNGQGGGAPALSCLVHWQGDRLPVLL